MRFLQTDDQGKGKGRAAAPGAGGGPAGARRGGGILGATKLRGGAVEDPVDLALELRLRGEADLTADLAAFAEDQQGREALDAIPRTAS